MSTTHQSSGSEGDPRIPVDDRKRKRMLSNRESARRSRMRKLHHLEDLSRQGDQLRDENRRIAVKTDAIAEQYINLESENAVLRTQMLELTERLKSMNSVLRFVEEFSGAELDIPEIPEHVTKPWKLASPAYPIMDPMPEILDPLLRPWQLPCAAQASADMFFC